MSGRKLFGAALMLSPFVGLFVAGLILSGPLLALGLMLVPFACAAIISQGLEWWFSD